MELIEIITQHSLYRKTSGERGMKYKVGETDGKTLNGGLFFEEKLSSLRLGNAKLNSCIFRETDFYGNTWYQVELTNCHFSRCEFSKSEMFDPVFENCIFDQCKFRSAELSTPEFINCIFVNSDFTNLLLVGGKMSNCVLSGTITGGYQYEDTTDKENVIWTPQIETPDSSAAQP